MSAGRKLHQVEHDIQQDLCQSAFDKVRRNVYMVLVMSSFATPERCNISLSYIQHCRSKNKRGTAPK